jgi:uncharacterized protein YjbI with pentapeptide repeats
MLTFATDKIGGNNLRVFKTSKVLIGNGGIMAKDFSGQDCRGRSFKNQDLTGADFSDSDVRGVDFSGKDLTGAKFCNARMGRSIRMSCSISSLQVPLAIIAFSIVFVGNMFLANFVKKILTTLAIYSDVNLTLVMISYTLIFISIILVSVNRNHFSYLYWFFWLILIFSIPLTIIKIEGAIYIFFVVVMVGALTGIGSIVASVAVTNPNAESERIPSTISTIIAVSLMLGFHDDITSILKQTVGVSVTLPSIIFIFLQMYLGKRAIEKEEPILNYLRQWILYFNCLGGTKFEFATLKELDFSQADLKNARFKNSNFISCRFQQAKNHHLASTDGTPLKPRKVRDLVIDGIITDKNFSTLDLRGLDFSNLNLEGFDFSHANVSGANLSHTQMTGAILEGWNIDTETRLDDIDCRYYYYLDNGAKKRMPPEGEEYKTGEFTRIFQKIANTIDFIANDEMEVAAIKLSVEQVREESGNNEIKVQTVEEKEGFSVVKVSVPKTEDRGILYQKVKNLTQDYKTKIQVSIAEDRVRVEDNQSQISYLKEQLEKQREQLDKQREDFLAKIKSKILIKNSTIINDGVMNLGEVIGNISNH